MIYERGKLRYAIYFCVLALLLQYSLALPVMEASRQALALDGHHQQQRGRQCLTAQANPDSIQPTPEHIVKVFGSGQVENFVLSLPLERRTDQQTRTGRDRGEGARTVLCRGVWPFPPKALTKPRHVRAVYFMEWQNERRERHAIHELYLLLSPELVHKMILEGNVSVSLACTNSEVYCFNIHYKDLTVEGVSPHRLLRRSAEKSYKSHDSPTNEHTASSGPVLAVGAAVVSLIVLVVLVALCAGTSSYEPKPKAEITLQKSGSEAPRPSSEVTVQFQSSQPVHVEVETRSEAAATNGGVTATKEGEKSSPKTRDSLERKVSPPSEEDKGREDRARTLSARSFDPLPAIPNLDTVEDGRQRSKNSPPVAGGMDDEDDEAGYAYARVGGAAVATADSDKEDKSDSASGGQSSGLPPYGKVSHHVTKAKVTETEEYAEVKEVFRGPLATAATSRGRSATDPIDPAEAGADSLREKRALTHTHMMPLPAVPRPQENIDDSEMYDSIPDDMRNSQVPLPQQAPAAAVTTTTKPRPKERLYESMDDMEDTYESVPDNLKPDSPAPMSPATPNTSPSKAPLLNLSPSISPPMPPSSPVPKTTAKEPEKKSLEKTLSASQAEQEGDGKRRFSFFGRKKTASVSGVGSKKERDKHKDQKVHKDHKDHKDTKDHKEHHHMPHQPLPDVPSQPPAMSPPLPPIPNQDDDEDTTYDTPQLDFMAGPARLSPISSPMSPMSPSGLFEAKSQSLPSSARGAGASIFHSRAHVPLPRVPEDSGQGLVVRERVLESPVRGEEEEKPYDSVTVLPGGEKPYDTVQVLDEGENMDEPNYDTVHPEDIFKLLHEDENNEADPGYDRVKQLREEEGNLEGGEEEEGAAAPKEREGAGIRYGKVVRPTSPEDDKVGIVPEHDEEGYAVVPEDFKMRKRALSASKGVGPKVKHETSEAGYNSINEVEEVATASTDEPVEPSEPYATVDIRAKKEPVEPSESYATVDIIAKKEKKTDTLTSEQESALRQRSVSPVPPPLPPVGDLGDIEEFSQPPIPIQSEGIHELVPADDERGGPSSSLEPPGSDDPPYAKVKSKDHAYAELDLGAVRERAKLVTPDDTNETEATYDEVDAEAAKSAAALKDTALGYDTVADADIVKEGEEALGYHTVSSTDSDRKTQQEQSSGYDTVIDSDEGRGENGASIRSQVELETPKLESAEPQQLYDSLEPLAKKDEEGKEEEPAGNLYYLLEAEQVENGVSPEDVEEERYEEIDEDRRMQLIEKQKRSSQGKLS